jgi:excisionase family DNA binding protein
LCRFVFQLARPDDPDVLPVQHRLMKAISVRQQWRAALDTARRRAVDQLSTVSRTGGVNGEGNKAMGDKKSVRPIEAARLLGVCRDTVYVLMRAGRLRVLRPGDRHRPAPW